MTEKIEWYREVLELEPNSKVFFPLSRLLAQDGQVQEALSTLKSGLERHPEYLEARLYLIELLHKYGFTEQCEQQVDQLSRMFASYAGFWRAWAACLSTEKEADTASVLRFLAAQFVAGPIQLHDVLNRGLESFMAETASQVNQNARAEESANVAAATIQQAVQEPVTAPEAELEKALPDLPENLPASEEQTLQTGADLLDAEVAEFAEVAEAPTVVPQETVEAVSSVGDLPEEAEIEACAQDESDLSVSAPLDLADAQDAGIIAGEPDLAEPELEQATEDSSALPETFADESYTLMGEEPAMVEQNEVAARAEESVEVDAQMPVEEAIVTENLEADAEAPASPAELDELDAIMEEAEAAQGNADELALEAEPLDNELPAVENEPQDAAETIAAQAPEAPAPGIDLASELGDIEADIAGMAEKAAAAEPVAVEAKPAAPMANASEESLLSMESAIGELELPGMDEMEAALPEPDVKLENAQAPVVETAQNEILLETPTQAEPEAKAFVEEPAAAAGDAFEDVAEPFSLRTRSMAEVLAEQGDIQGALDIYHELAAAAHSKDEVEDINRRIATLEGRLAFKAPAQDEYAEPEHSSPSRDKLIGMLEALANRVEARAHS